MESVQVEVKIEIGHKASCKKTLSPEGFTHDWTVFVRGPESCDISHFVEKVVFYLHESFAKPRRVLKEPPYSVAEAGYGSFYLPIEVYFKNKEEPRKLKLDYDLFLPVYGSPPIDNIRSEALTFRNPTEEFKKKLVKGGGIVTCMGTVNGLHSASSPGKGTLHPQSMDTNAGKETNNISDKNNTQKHATSLQEPDKVKKQRHDGVVGNKTVKMQETVTTPGLKRSSSTSGADDLPSQPTVKKKKKKTDEGTPKNKPVGFIPLELPVPGNENKDKLDEMKDVKLKIKSLPSKSAGNDKKKTRRSSSEVGTGESANKLLKTADSTSTKKAKLKSPKEDLKQVKQEEKKVEKITFRRSSGDSWSSSTSSSSLLGNASGTKNTALNALLAEIGDDDDDDDDDEVDIFTPFQSSSTHTAKTQKQKSSSVISPNNSSQSKDSKDSSKVKVKGSTQTKKSETSKNGRKNGLKSPTTKSPSVKQSPKPKLKETKQGSNGQQNPSTELIQLYRRLTTLKDSSVLQRVADILEATGRFELTDTTLDFDLCALDKMTIKKIENSINSESSPRQAPFKSR